MRRPPRRADSIVRARLRGRRGDGSREVSEMVLAIFLPVLLLLFLLAMERLEARLLPAASIAHPEDGVVGDQGDHQPEVHLATQLSIPAPTPATGAVTVPAAAR